MISRSLLRLIAIPTIVVLVLFLTVPPEVIGGRGGGGGGRGGGGGYSREGTASEGRFSSSKGSRKALAPVAGSREEAQASKVGAVTRRIEAVIRRTGKAVPARTRLSANKPNRALPARIKLSANKPHKTKQIRASRAPLSARTPTNKVPTAGSRVVRIMARTRSRIARILQTTTDLPGPVVPGLAVVRRVIGAVTMLGWRPSPEPGWPWVQQSRAFLCNLRPS